MMRVCSLSAPGLCTHECFCLEGPSSGVPSASVASVCLSGLDFSNTSGKAFMTRVPDPQRGKGSSSRLPSTCADRTTVIMSRECDPTRAEGHISILRLQAKIGTQQMVAKHPDVGRNPELHGTWVNGVRRQQEDRGL